MTSFCDLWLFAWWSLKQVPSTLCQKKNDWNISGCGTRVLQNAPKSTLLGFGGHQATVIWVVPVIQGYTDPRPTCIYMLYTFYITYCTTLFCKYMYPYLVLYNQDAEYAICWCFERKSEFEKAAQETEKDRMDMDVSKKIMVPPNHPF